MIENWWPTQIGSYDNPDHKILKKDLVNYCLKLKGKIKKGGEMWVSGDTFNTSDGAFDVMKDKKFEKLNNFVSNCVERYIKEIGMVFKISNSDGWFNIYEKGDYQEYHEHCGFVISAVYFLKAQENSSNLFFMPAFRDQNRINYTQPGINTQAPVFYKPVEGRLIVFRSYLPHCVGKHMLKDKRITLAYNFR